MYECHEFYTDNNRKHQHQTVSALNMLHFANKKKRTPTPTIIHRR